MSNSVQEAPGRTIDFDRALSLLQTANGHLRKNIGRPCSCQHCTVCALRYLAYELPKRIQAEVLAAHLKEIESEQSYRKDDSQAVWDVFERIKTVLKRLQPAAADLEEFEKRVQRESYGAARILWTAGICDLLKIPKPRPDGSGLEWLLREGGHALEELLREERIKELDRFCDDAPEYSQEIIEFIENRYKQLGAAPYNKEKARAIEGKG